MTQGRLYIVVPNFPTNEYTAARAENFRVWLAKNRSPLGNAHDLTVTDVELRAEGVYVLGSGATIQFSPPPLAVSKRRGRKEASRGTPKGLALRLALQIILDEVDRAGVVERNNTYIVQVDASGAFDFNSIHVILDTLLDEGRGLDVVLGRRPGADRLMGSEDRVQVELFEEYLVETVVKGRSPSDMAPMYADTQAGCWGLRCSALERLSLTAPAYELEFDLFCSALMSGVRVDLSEDLIPGTRIGPSGVSNVLQSGKKDHSVEVRKLPFIAHKLRLDTLSMRGALERYITSGGRLPEGYISMVQELYPSL